MGSIWAGAVRLRDVRTRVWRVAVLWGLSPLALAASVPWTPSTSARHAIEVLVDDGGLPLTVSQWPLPREAVQRALDTLPADLPPALAAARAQVQAELRAQQSARVGLTLRERKDALPAFGDDATPGSSLQLRSGEYDGPHLALQAGGRLDPVADSGQVHATARLDDSAIVTDAFGVQAQAWAHRSWWGPGWQSALPLSNNPPPLDGIGFQRAAVLPSESPWLSWLGPWNADFFVARTEGEPLGPGSNPLLSGLRLTARPLPLLEIGLTRMVQFGGTGHPETLGAFARAVVSAHANATNGKQRFDSGNGLAGFDLRLRCPFGVRCAGYAQVMGEDDRKHLPFKYLETVGAEAWSADGVTRFYFEAAEIGCRESWTRRTTPRCAYQNYAYPDGFTDGNRWLGASVGTDGKLITLGWIDSDWDSEVRLDYGNVGSNVGTFGKPFEPFLPGRPLWALSARRGWHFGSTTVTPEFDWTRVEWTNGVHVSSRVGLEMSTTLDDLGLAAPNRIGQALSGAAGPTTDRLLVAGALIGGAALFDRAANSYAADHHNEPALKVLRQTGDVLPYAEFGLAGAAWLARSGSADGNVALASVESGLSAVAISELIKQAVDRSRPRDERGAADFGHDKRKESSFPSIHTALSWSVITPIAQHYDAPWLYGVAALTNVGRVAGREHWLSDTVAGSVLGYVVGDWFGKRANDGTLPGSSVVLVPHGIVVSTTFR
jgi:membrane-associated phospholipid phosphatase